MFLGLLSAIVVFVITINFIVFNLLTEIAEQELLEEMENAVVAYRRFDEQRRKLLRTQSLAVAQTVHLKATLAIPGVDTETVRVAGQNLEGVSDIDLLLIFDDAGKLLTSVHENNSPTTITEHSPGIGRATQGEVSLELWNRDDGLYQVAVAPAVVNFQVVGLVATGQRIDNVKAIQVAEDISGANAVWQYDAENSEDEIPDNDKRLLKTRGEVLRDVEGTPLERLDASGSILFKATMTHPDIGAALIFYRKLDLAASGVARMRSIVLACSAAIVFLSMLLSYRIAGRISRPIVRLTQATADFGGGDLSVRLKPASSDEIGTLTEAFNSMADDIVANRQELVASLDAAEAANRAKSEFLGRMSHELRTPMNGVIGMAEILLASDINSQQREFAQTILDSGDGLMSIINDVLDVSRIEAGELDLNIASFDIYDTIRGSTEMLSHHAESKGLRLVCPLDPNETLWVYGDKLRLRQVLTNLIGNAIKFTDRGQISLRVKSEDADDNSVTLTIEVSDSGIGIEPGELVHMFDTFTQGDGSGTRRFGGTGLGLPISKQLVELMGGQVSVDSELGRGSTFRIRVTFRRDIVTTSLELQASESNTQPSSSHSRVQPLSRPASILLAEDNAANQQVAMTMLRMIGCKTDVAEDGLIALEKVKSERYDIVLMDCQMPNMDGFAATAAIREWEAEQENSAAIPIIAVTANALVTDRERCLAAGMSDYISKPFSMADLKEGIERWLPDERSMLEPSPDSELKSIGIRELDELREFGATNDDIAEIIACYVESSESSMEGMAAAVDARNRQELSSVAHRLKGGSGQVGAHAAADICAKIDSEASAAEWHTLADLIQTLREEVERVNRELNSRFSSNVAQTQ